MRPLSAAVRAQTILASCRRVTLCPGRGGAASGGGGFLGAVSGLVPWEGVPYLLLEPGGSVPTGSVHLTCAGVEELGTLVLVGRCGSSNPGTAVPSPDDRMRVVPLVVDQVRVVVPGPTRDGRRTLPVPVELFLRARPDLWTLYRDDIVDHLEQHHQDELRRLVNPTPNIGGGAAPGGVVVVRDVGPEGLVLTRLTLDGVVDQVLPFQPTMTDPRLLGAWLRGHRHPG